MRNLSAEINALPGATICYFQENEHFIRQGDRIDYVYNLIDGLCCQYAISDSGEEHILMVQGSDDTSWSLLGVLYLFSDCISSMNFEARSPCVCYKIPRESIMQYLSTNSSLLADLLRQCMSLYSDTYKHLKYRWNGNTVGQLCQFMLDKAHEQQGQLVLDKFYTNVRISQFLGVHNITASRIIKSLKDAGIIKRASGIVIVQPEELRKYISGENKLVYAASGLSTKE